MDAKVIWSPEAVEDVESVAEYIARDSKFYASATVSKFLDYSHSIAKFPKAGRLFEETGNKGELQ